MNEMSEGRKEVNEGRTVRSEVRKDGRKERKRRRRVT